MSYTLENLMNILVFPVDFMCKVICMSLFCILSLQYFQFNNDDETGHHEFGSIDNDDIDAAYK